MIADFFNLAFPKYSFVLSAPEILGFLQLTVFVDGKHLCVVAVRDNGTVDVIASNFCIQAIEMYDPEFTDRLGKLLGILHHVKTDISESGHFVVKLVTDGAI